MIDAHIAGVGMTRFGKYPDLRIRELAAHAVELALGDAGLQRSVIEQAWFANAGWGANGGQDCIRGEVALREAGLAGLPIVNVENACAGGSTALHGAWLAVASGTHDVVLAVGAEKVFQRDRLRMFATFLGGLDVEALPDLMREGRRQAEQYPVPPETGAAGPRAGNGGVGATARDRRTAGSWARTLKDLVVIADHYQIDVGRIVRDALRSRGRGRGKRGADHSPFMDVYAIAARRHMQTYGSTREQLAAIASKNHAHGVANPLAQIRRACSPEAILADRPVAYPLTRGMCAPVGDGAAAVLICSERFARRHQPERAVRIRASVLASGRRHGDGEPGVAERAATAAYERAGVGPGELHLAEVHDATAFGELHQAEALGLCAKGEGGVLALSGATRVGGRLPLNPSGGLECRGHPIAASGLAQIHELTMQLRGECNGRQVEGARLALAQNGGGMLEGEEAAMGIHILEAPGRRA
ncbi:MAG: thiolase family protein [Myxococcota bacterium]